MRSLSLSRPSYPQRTFELRRRPVRAYLSTLPLARYPAQERRYFFRAVHAPWGKHVALSEQLIGLTNISLKPNTLIGTAHNPFRTARGSVGGGRYTIRANNPYHEEPVTILSSQYRPRGP